MSRSRRNKTRKHLHSNRPRKAHDDYWCDYCLSQVEHKHVKQALRGVDESVGSRERMASLRKISRFASPGGTGSMVYNTDDGDHRPYPS